MPNLVVVAIPSENDYVWKISSEKIPHMTILYLGEMPVKNFTMIAGFVDFAARQALGRFEMSVDRRDVLGPEKADVLHFSKSKWSGYEDVAAFRSFLLQDSNIKAAYEAVEQFPEWLPHLTLGYPETPAKPDNRDYPGISYVHFDKIALWFEDYSGFETPLKSHEWISEVAMGIIDLNNPKVKAGTAFLEHYGVKGMKWGVRRNPRRTTRGSEELRIGSTDKDFADARKDARWERKTQKVTSFTYQRKSNLKLIREATKTMKPELKALNKKPEYTSVKARIAIRNNRYNPRTDNPIASAYHKELSQIYMKHIRAAAKKKLTTSPSGKHEEYFWESRSHGAWTVGVRQVDTAKHADSADWTYSLRPVFDANGYIVDFEMIDDDMAQSNFVEEFLEHYGVKGMKWGVRRNRQPTAAVVTQKGKKLKARGGENQKPSQDAINAKALEQTIKKSGIHALDNDSLRKYNERLNLEANARRLQAQNVGSGQRFVKELLGVSSDFAIADIKTRASASQVRNSFNSTPSSSTALVRR